MRTWPIQDKIYMEGIKMQEIKFNLVIYYLQTKTRSFMEALKLAENFMGVFKCKSNL